MEEAVEVCVGTKLGRPKIMTDEFEHRFSLFLDDARQIGSPRSWQRAAVDIRDYLNKEDLVVEGFDNNTPGKVKQ